jgi:hypothetical protein
MARNEPVSTIKGKYAGKCTECNLDRGDWESKGTPCGRCGHTFETEAVPLTLDGEVKVIEEGK